MLFAFSNLDEMNAYVANNRCQPSSVQYFERSDDGLDRVGFYAATLIDKDSKVESVVDSRNENDLSVNYPEVALKTIKAVWDTHKSWGACCDVLNSLVHTHGSICLDDMGLDKAAWPVAGEESFEGSRSSKSTDNGWTITQLSNSTKKLTIQEEEDVAEEDEGDWELLEEQEEGGGDAENEVVLNTVAAAVSFVPLGTGYRDKVLAARGAGSESVCNDGGDDDDSVMVSSQQQPWRPSIVVAPLSNKRRIDRVYVGSGAAEHRDDEDDDPLNEFYESREFLKSTVSACRAAAVSKIRPAALEQKLKRIAQKGGHGGGGGAAAAV